MKKRTYSEMQAQIRKNRKKGLVGQPRKKTTPKRPGPYGGGSVRG